LRILSDPHGHVAIDASGMLMDTSGEPVTAVGDQFVVHMDRESLNDFLLGKYDVTCAFEQDREIAWKIRSQVHPPIGHVYGYTLEPVDGATVVTSYHDWSNTDPVWKNATSSQSTPKARYAPTSASWPATPNPASPNRPELSRPLRGEVARHSVTRSKLLLSLKNDAWRRRWRER
jgi:hypothetical protein